MTVTLLCLCASHVCGDVRAQRLEYLLDSISAQTTNKFKLYLGISFETDDLRKRIDAKLKKDNNSTVHTFLFSKRQAQFDRYHAIMTALHKKQYVTREQESNTYLSFTDDDDLWAPQRMDVFRIGAEKLRTDPRNPMYMFTIKHFKKNIEEQDFTDWRQLPFGSEDMFEVHYPREYCDIVCTFALFKRWFEVASPALLSWLLCDVVLVKWVVKTASIKDHQQEPTYLRMNCSLPLYYYRQSVRSIRDLQSIFESFGNIESSQPGYLILLNIELNHVFWPVTHHELINKIMHAIPGLSREVCVDLLKRVRRLPLWQHIFVDLLKTEGVKSQSCLAA